MIFTRKHAYSAGPRLALRYGNTNNGGNAGPFYVNANNSLTNSNTNIGSRSAEMTGINALTHINHAACFRDRKVNGRTIFNHLW